MILTWKNVEEEGSELPFEENEGWVPLLQRRWAQWLVRALLSIVAIWGTLLLLASHQEAMLRSELMEIIEAERQVKRDGDIDLARSLIDPATPAEWQAGYFEYMKAPLHLDTPTIKTVMLEEEETWALVKLAWPYWSDRENEMVESVEWRAYRLIDGTWLRTPLMETTTEMVEHRTDHFILRAPPRELTMLTRAPGLQLDLEGLRQHVVSTWPRAWINDSLITIEVVPEEFGFSPITEQDGSAIWMASPFASPQNYAHPTGSIELEYRQTLAERVIYVLTISPTRAPTEAARRYLSFFHELQYFEALQHSLDVEERKDFRDDLREGLEGQWLSPFGDATTRDPQRSVPVRFEDGIRYYSRLLLLEQLTAGEGMEMPGQLATEMEKMPPESFDMATLFERVTGRTREELEAQAREYATTVEE